MAKAYSILTLTYYFCNIWQLYQLLKKWSTFTKPIDTLEIIKCQFVIFLSPVFASIDITIFSAPRPPENKGCTINSSKMVQTWCKWITIPKTYLIDYWYISLLLGPQNSQLHKYKRNIHYLYKSVIILTRTRDCFPFSPNYPCALGAKMRCKGPKNDDHFSFFWKSSTCRWDKFH